MRDEEEGDEEESEVIARGSVPPLDTPTEPPIGSCFVIMAYGSRVLDSYYDAAIKPTVERARLRCVRPDQLPDTTKISDQIANGIRESRVVIADLTRDRPNCYFEAGFALAAGKDIIFQRLVSEPEFPHVIHFDVSDYQHMVYGTAQELSTQLADRLRYVLAKQEGEAGAERAKSRRRERRPRARDV